MTVELSGLEFFARHGCLDAERKDGNTFLVDVKYTYDGLQAAIDDDLSKAVDYSEIYAIVAREMSIPSGLLENVAWRIRRSILLSFGEISSVEVRVRKKNPPVGGPAQWSSVTVSDVEAE